MIAIACLCFAPSLLVVILGAVLAVADIVNVLRRMRARHRRARRDLERGRFEYEAMRARRRRYTPPKSMTGGYR
jgi:hypothetical protein